MKILAISSLFPNKIQPRHGIFIEHRLRNLVASYAIDLKVLAPVPWFPINNDLFKTYSIYNEVPRSDRRYGMDILYPRYVVIPKIGMSFTPFLYALSLIKPITQLIKQGYDFDVIDGYYLYPDGVAAVMLGKYFNKPVVITALGSDVNRLTKYSIPRKLIKWSAERASAITTVSNALKSELVTLGVKEDKIRAILHGVDLDLFQLPKDKNTLRKQLGINRRTLLSVGNLIKLKGHDLIIQSMLDQPDIDLLIAGHGEEEHRLKSLVKKLKIEDRVQFLGLVKQEDLCSYYGAVDALVLASESEGIANVLLESMACGTPVIASNVGGLPEVVTTLQQVFIRRALTTGNYQSGYCPI